MTECNVLNILPIDGDTAIVVDGDRKLFKNGITVRDEYGQLYEVMSVGIEKNISENINSDRTSLFLSGKFSSKKIYL